MEEDVDTLISLGLAERQARVLLILTKYGKSTARALTHVSKLPRQDVYQVLDELEHFGFVEKKLSSPTEFVAVPLSVVCSELMAARVKKTGELMEKAKVMVKSIKKADSTQIADNESCLLVVPERQAFVNRLKKSVEKAEKCIDIITPIKFLNQGLLSLDEELKRAAKRGVLARFIININTESDSKSAFLHEFAEKQGFEFKAISGHSSLRFCIYDKKEVSVVLSLQGDFAKSSLLWSNCKSLVDTFQDHFDILWLAAKSFSARKVDC